MAAYRIIIHASQSAQLFLACAEARNVTCHSVNRLTSCYGFYRDCMKVSPERPLGRKIDVPFYFVFFIQKYLITTRRNSLPKFQREVSSETRLEREAQDNQENAIYVLIRTPILPFF